MDNGAGSYRRFLGGDEEGLADIVREYKDGLILYLNSFVNNIHTAEDLTEDTFFRLMVKRPHFAGKSSFKSWLYAIGRHIAVDHIRRQSRASLTDPEDAETAREQTDLEESYLREERKIAVRRALDKLPSDYRQIIWLIYFEELSHEEAAFVMHKTPRQMRNLLYRAKLAMKTQLEKEGITDENFG